MKWTAWNRGDAFTFGKKNDVDSAKVTFCHWTEEGECRVVSFALEADGSITVEQSTAEAGDSSITQESVYRITVPGWEEE